MRVTSNNALSGLIKPPALPVVLTQKRGIVRAEASRGCPWSKCIFCAVAYKYNHSLWRPIPIEKIINDLNNVSRYCPQMVYFTDEEFIGNDLDRLKKVLLSIIINKQQGIIYPQITFFVSVSVQSILMIRSSLEEDYIYNLFQKAGFTDFFLGIESGSENQLKRYNKSISTADNLYAVNILRKYGFNLDIGFIMFDPEMDVNDLILNLNFMNEAGLSNHNARFTKSIRIVPYTPIYKRLADTFLMEKDIDPVMMMYKYKFKIADVQLIYNTFVQWEQKNLQNSYELQNEYRGETSNDYDKQQVNDKLSKIRSHDHDFLEKCVQEVLLKSATPLEDRLNKLLIMN